MDDLLSIAVSNAVAATVLALAALAIGAVYRRPALVHGLWLLVLLKLVTPPLLYFPVDWKTVAASPPQAVAEREEATLAPPGGPSGARPTLELPDPPAVEEEPGDIEPLLPIEEPASPSPASPTDAPLWPQMLRIVWAFGALLWFLLAMDRLHHFRRLLRFARPAPAALQERTSRLALSLGLRRCPRVRLLPGRIAPMLWANGGPPRLLVPADLLNVLSEEQLDTLLLHELAHLRRRDHWVRVLEFVVMGLYWWHPVVWYARRELREAEEQCCDAWVVSTLPGAGRTYASALLDTLDFLSTTRAAVPPLASGLSQIADLKRRLTMIMQANTPRSLTWPGCLAVVALGLALLPMMPSLHGEPPTKEEARKSIEQAEDALKHAKAALEYQKAVLAAKKAELELAEKRLRNESARAVIELDKGGEGHLHARVERKTSYRVEITLLADADVNPKELVGKIRKVLPEKLRGNVVLREASQSYQLLLKTQPEAATSSSSTRPAAPSLRPFHQPNASTGRGQPPASYDDRRTAPSSRSSENRINELEKKLDKVLQEMQELRKQMKQSRGRPVPPAPPTPPPTPTGSNGYPQVPAPPTPPPPPGVNSVSPVDPAPPAPPAPPGNPYRTVTPRAPRSGRTNPPPPPQADREP